MELYIQIMEWILLSPEKTAVHNEVLRVLYLHTDPILPLPRLRTLSVMWWQLNTVEFAVP